MTKHYRGKLLETSVLPGAKCASMYMNQNDILEDHMLNGLFLHENPGSYKCLTIRKEGKDTEDLKLNVLKMWSK